GTNPGPFADPAQRTAAAARTHGCGRAPDRRLAGAPPRPGLGQRENPKTARGMARNEDGRLLPAGAACLRRGRPRDAGGQSGSELARRGERTGPTAALAVSSMWAWPRRTTSV